ncbi:MAG: LysR family transcriptional regulator [Proteobacteria bacterium]|nr:LysR family transcriptional regulator [Pseudomonadota bacterium]MCL2308284.1 LysR family transcriptional regulator [Pseudomonadota bacterium]
MKNTPLDTELLLLFKALHETRSLTLAAGRLGMSQAAASRALSKLRDIFNDNLFIKSGYGMLATPRAETLFPLVLNSLASLEQLMTPEKFDPALLARVFRVGASDNGVFTIISRVLNDLFSQAPHAQLDIAPINDDLYTCLKDGRMDLAIHPVLPLPPDFHEYLLFEARYACIVRKCHPLAHYAEKGQAPPLDEINRYRRMQISVQQAGKPRYVIDDVAFLSPPTQEVAVWVPYFLAAPLILAETDLILTLPRHTAARFIEMAPLVMFPCPEPPNTFFTRLVWHHRVHHDPAIQWLRSLFVKHVADRPSRDQRSGVGWR